MLPMTLPQTMQSPGDEMTIAPATRDDLFPLLKLFDEAVTWLNAHGLGNQGGSELFSTSLERQRQFLRWIDAGVFFAARLQGQIFGSVSLRPAPPGYIAKHWWPFLTSTLYLEA